MYPGSRTMVPPHYKFSACHCSGHSKTMESEDGKNLAEPPAAQPLRLSISMQMLSLLVKSANGVIRRDNFTVRRWLANLEEMIRLPACAAPVAGVSSRDEFVDQSDGIWVRIFTPQSVRSSCPSCPVVVYFHGGGFAVLRPDFFLYDIFCRRLANSAACIVVSVHYRLSPEHKYPVAHDDCWRVLKWLAAVNNTGVLPAAADLSKCFLAGDSAGGNLAHFASCRAAAEELPGLQVRGTVLIQPFFGAEQRSESELLLRDGPIINQEMTDWYWRAYLPEGDNRDHPICNVFGPRSAELGIDLDGLPLPPSLIIVGELDLLKDAQIKFARGLAGAGKKVRLLLYRAVHCFHIFYRLPSSRQVLVDILDFMKEQSCA